MRTREELRKNTTIKDLLSICETEKCPNLHFDFHYEDFEEYLLKLIKRVFGVHPSDPLEFLLLRINDPKIKAVENKTYGEVIALNPKLNNHSNALNARGFNDLTIAEICQDCFIYENPTELRKIYGISDVKFNTMLDEIIINEFNEVRGNAFKFLYDFYCENESKVKSDSKYQKTYGQLKSELNAKEAEARKQKNARPVKVSYPIQNFTIPPVTDPDRQKKSEGVIKQLTESLKVVPNQPSSSSPSLNISSLFEKYPIKVNSLESFLKNGKNKVGIKARDSNRPAVAPHIGSLLAKRATASSNGNDVHPEQVTPLSSTHNDANPEQVAPSFPQENEKPNRQMSQRFFPVPLPLDTFEVEDFAHLLQMTPGFANEHNPFIAPDFENEADLFNDALLEESEQPNKKPKNI